MTMMKVIRDASGAVINIGEWDYMFSEDERGGMTVVNNPFPEGATETEEMIVRGWDVGLYVEGDPRASA